MILLFAPAKNMAPDDGYFGPLTSPLFQQEVREIRTWLESLDVADLKAVHKVSDKLARQAYEQLHHPIPASPALLSYKGIAYQYMAPHLFSDEMNAYVSKHLRILSAVYGYLRPFDAIVPYRLEMQAKTPFQLYSYWSERIAALIQDEPVVNLASEEYARVLRRHVDLVDVRFCERDGDKLKEKGVYVKMARGAMVRWMAEENIEAVEDMKRFDGLGYAYDAAASTPSCLVFVRQKEKS